MFEFNGDRGDKEQVRPYLARYSELKAAGLRYNDDFKGKIEGIAGSPREDTAIYMLSCLHSIEEERAQITEALAAGYEPVGEGQPGERRRFSDVILYRPDYFVGGTGHLSHLERARVAFNGHGRPIEVIPARKQSGYPISGAQVLVRS